MQTKTTTPSWRNSWVDNCIKQFGLAGFIDEELIKETAQARDCTETEAAQMHFVTLSVGMAEG